MTDSLYSFAVRTCRSPATELRTKCHMSLIMDGKQRHEAGGGDSDNLQAAINSGAASTSGTSAQSRAKIYFNPDAKEFVPRTSYVATNSDGRSRSPVALLFESQVAAVASASNSSSNPIDEGPRAPSLLPEVVTGPLSSPTGRSYADVASAGGAATGRQSLSYTEMIDSLQELCPYAMNGECRFGEKCVLLHGLVCDYCQKGCLHPTNQHLRDLHIKECIDQHRRDMEHSFAVARSADKMCGICMEMVVEKAAVGDRRFGILTQCNHIFCLNCIRQWRGKVDDYESRVIRACPECRVSSDYVIPSRVWIDAKDEKQKLIENYKKALRQKECKHYNHGDGICPFGNKCFYRHCTKNGTPVDVGPPVRIFTHDGRRAMAGTGVSISSFLQDYVGIWSNDLNVLMFAGDDTSDTDSEVGEAFSDYL